MESRACLVVVDALVFKSSQRAVWGFPASGCRWVLKSAFRCQTRSSGSRRKGVISSHLQLFSASFSFRRKACLRCGRRDEGAGAAGTLGATWFLLWALWPPLVCSFAWHGHQVQASGRNLQSAPGPCQPPLSEPLIDQVGGWSQGPPGTAALPSAGDWLMEGACGSFLSLTLFLLHVIQQEFASFSVWPHATVPRPLSSSPGLYLIAHVTLSSREASR